MYSLETQINRVIRLGRKIKEKHRPLLVSFENMDDKAVVVSRSYLLHHNEQYKTVFIAPDRTKLEQEKHKRLIAELKERKIQRRRKFDYQKWMDNC